MSPRTEGSSSAVSSARVDLEQLGDRRGDRADRQLAVARAHERDQRRAGLHCPAEAAALAQQHGRRALVARPRVPLLGHIRRDGEPRRRESAVRACRPASRGRRARRRGGRRGPPRSRRASRAAAPACAASALPPPAVAAARSRSRPRSRPRAAKSSSQAREELVEFGRSGPCAAVADPGLGVLGGILDVALDHPRVEVRGAPRCRASRAPGRRRRRRRGTPSWRGAARHRPAPGRRAHLLDDGFDERVADHPAVPVLVRGHTVAARGDDERRVGHDVVEPLAGDRFEQAPEAELDVRRRR